MLKQAMQGLCQNVGETPAARYRSDRIQGRPPATPPEGPGDLHPLSGFLASERAIPPQQPDRVISSYRILICY